MIKVICAWCNKILSEGSEDSISHGICDDCADTFSTEYNKLQEDLQ